MVFGNSVFAPITTEVVEFGWLALNDVPKTVRKVNPTDAEGFGVNELKLKVNELAGFMPWSAANVAVLSAGMSAVYASVV